MENFTTVLFNSIWCGLAAMGFSILFNTPTRTLGIIWFGGFVAGMVKYGALTAFPGVSIIAASFLAALAVGFLSIPMAHFRHVPPVIFAIPSVIPLIPGIFAYRTMLGLIRLTSANDADFSQAIENTVRNGVTTLFIVLVLTLGVVLPMYLIRKESAKTVKWKLPGT